MDRGAWWAITTGVAKSQTRLGAHTDTKEIQEKSGRGDSLMTQGLGLHTLTTEGLSSIPGQGMKILQAAWHSLYIYVCVCVCVHAR